MSGKTCGPPIGVGCPEIGKAQQPQYQGHNQLASGCRIMQKQDPDSQVARTEQRADHDHRHQADQPDAHERPGGHAGIKTGPIGNRQYIAAQAEKEIDRQAGVRGKKRFTEPMAEMVQQHRKSCHTTQSIQRSIVVSLFHTATFSGADRAAQLPSANIPESPMPGRLFKTSSLAGLMQGRLHRDNVNSPKPGLVAGRRADGRIAPQCRAAVMRSQ